MAKSVLDAPHFQDETAAFAYVEAHLWPNGPACPFCGETARIGKLQGKTTRPGLRKCYACGKPFTVRIGTIFESSHLPLRLWLQVIHLICASKKGVSTRQIQRMLRCSMKTAWFLAHRVREAMKDDGSAGPLGGEGKSIEADETYYGPKEYRLKANGRIVGKQGPGGKAKVVSLVERGGRAKSFKVENIDAKTVRKVLLDNASNKSVLMTDEAGIYPSIGLDFAGHKTVMHSAGEYVRGDAHTNTIEGFFSIFKRGMTGVYQHCSEQHLERYLAEFDFRYSNRDRLGIDDAERAAIALKGSKDKRLSYTTFDQEKRSLA